MTKPIFSLIVIILAIGFDFLYVRPAYKHVQERRTDIVTLSNILSNSSRIETLISETSGNLNSVDTAARARFAVFLPEKIDHIRFANNIQHIGLKNGVFLENIRVEAVSGGTQISESEGNTLSQASVSAILFGDKAQGENLSTSSSKRYAVTKVTFSFSATYETFQLLLNDFERSLGLVNIKSLYFTQAPSSSEAKSSKGDEAVLYDYGVELETYSLI